MTEATEANINGVISAMTEMTLRKAFLAQHPFTSDAVQKCFTVEFGLRTEADLKRQEKKLTKLIKAFTKADRVAYLTTYKKWYAFKYAHYAPALRLARLQELQKLTLQVPIHMIQPIRYIEYMTLARLIPAFARLVSTFTSLDEYIAQFVAGRVR